jgi:N-6 DNA Methylase
MSRNQVTIQSRLLNNCGWDGCVESRLLRATDAWNESAEFRSHGHSLRRLFEDKEIGIDAVLCVEGRPTVCIKDDKALDDNAVEETRRKLWNLGGTTLLVVERPHRVDVFSTLSRPARQDGQGTGARLDAETIDNLEAAELALRVRQLIRRVETGAIYREHKTLFDPKNAVDRVLLDNLKEARNLLCPQPSRDGYRRTHALIGKFLFSCYLFDRGIIGPAYLVQHRLPEATDLLDLLADVRADRAGLLDKLFEVLQHDFNGSLFGNQLNIPVTDGEIAILRRLLSGEDLRARQPALFKLYDFGFIPVELISSIYQEFLGAEAEAAAPATRKNQPRKNGQRTQGAYYTPPRLAELTVDIATEGWNTLLDKRCLDPACGSGIFLVILFVRMAEEWRKRNPAASTRFRYDELMRLVSQNLCGVDIELTACLVTCFSLYLAFLDQMEPKEIMELREALERDTKKKILPRILWEKDKSRPRAPHIDSIRELDFFNLESQREFHLVIGNPPWVSRKPAPSAEEWLFSEQHNPAAKGLMQSERDQTLFPAKELACAFMWKAGLHLLDGGRVCQVLPSRVLLSNNTDGFQATWLQHHHLESVWLLADYRRVLFPGAVCPCFIGRYHPRREGEPLGEFAFVTPKVEFVDPREATIAVQPEDQKILSEAELVGAARSEATASLWKRNHWGSPRDLRLIDRLLRLPRLSKLCARPPRVDRYTAGKRAVKNKRRWWKGQGFQPLTESDLPEKGEEGVTNPWPIWWNERHAFLTADTAPDSFFLDKDSCKPYGRRPQEVRRTVAPELCRFPLVLVNKACTKFLFSDFDVIFQDDFQSIAGPIDDEVELLFLTAVLASPLSQYLLFHTTANIGIERDIARLEEMLELPFPLPDEMPNSNRAKSIVGKCADLMRDLKQDLLKPENRLKRHGLVEHVQRQLNEFVYEYFDVSKWERYLVEDTVAIFRPSSTPGSFESENLLTAKRSTPAHRKTYAATLVSTFRGWSRTKANLWAESCVAPKSELAFVTFGVGGRAKRYSESDAEERVEELLNKIRETCAHNEGAVFRCLRGFAFYEGKTVHLLKPLSRRFWTRTAALNDADEILTHMMEENGWGG